jgi:aryl-alcohol dehydrogenase-like predicted oxidoreductase/choline dehydrogenase-like flavoprotein
MLYDFDSPGDPAPSHADVCILGAGAAGILLATQLAAAGRRVTLLEGGGRHLEAASQEIYRSELAGLPHQGIHEGRFRTYGGTTTRWGGQILELDSADFEPRPHVPGSGWPFPKSTLTSFYERALRFEGLRRVERDDARVWASLGLTPPDLGPDFSMHFSRWCPERNFAELHARALLESSRLSVYLHASAVGFTLNDAGSAIRSINIRNHAGRSATVTADNFILCLGGIETTRLLLQPVQQGTAPWQTNGLLGRHYQDHIGLNGITVHDVATQPVQQYFGFVMAKGFQYANKIHLTAAQQAAHQALNIAGTIFSAENKGRDRTLNLLRAMARDRKVPKVTEALDAAIHMPGVLAERLSQHPPEWKHTIVTLHCEQSPLSASSITLSNDRDALGLFRTRLDWQVSDQEIASLRTYTKIAGQVFAEKGFARLKVPPGFFQDDALVRSLCGDSNHHMGGTRMATSPAAGIVDTDLKLHGIANGFVCSSSVFPCSGYSNPTHTVLALAMRLSDHLSGRSTSISATVEPAPMRRITLPGANKLIPQLGFGCAYLLGPGLDRARSRRVLDAAYDAGIRHFDAARLYGQGRTEALLGEFLQQHPDASVTTKYGVVPPNTPQRIVEALQRRIPAFGRATGWLKRNDKASFTAAEARASLERSLRDLRRDHVDLFLLHEPDVQDLQHDHLLTFLEAQRTAGKIANFGIGGEFYRMEPLHARRSAYTPVLQFEHSIFGPHLSLGDAYRIHYRTFAKPAAALAHLLGKDLELTRQWSAAVDADLAEPLILSRLLLKASLDQYPQSLTLFSSASEEHIFDNVAVATDPRLTTPAQRLIELVQPVAPTLAAKLYGEALSSSIAKQC